MAETEFYRALVLFRSPDEFECQVTAGSRRLQLLQVFNTALRQAADEVRMRLFSVANLYRLDAAVGKRVSFEHWGEQRVQLTPVLGAALLRTISYTYDKLGNLLTAKDPDSSLIYTYDNLGQQLTEDNAGTPDVPRVLLTTQYDKRERSSTTPPAARRASSTLLQRLTCWPITNTSTTPLDF